MVLEFKVHQLKEESKSYKRMVADANKPNEFIIVGEEMFTDLDCYKVQQMDEKGLCLIGGLTIEEFSLLVQKCDLIPKPGLGYEIMVIDVPKEYLTIEIIENIQRLNS